MRTVRGWLVLLSAALPAAARGDIDVEFRADRSLVVVGESVGIGVYMVSDSDEEQLLSGAQVIVAWEPGFLRLTGIDDAGGTPLLFSGFPSPDAYGLNESNPPQDGLGMYVAFANLGSPVPAAPGGTLLTTLRFEALAETQETPVDVVAEAGMPLGRTVVFDGTVPNRDVTGALRGAAVIVVAAPPGVVGLLLCALPAMRRGRRHEWHGQ